MDIMEIDEGVYKVCWEWYCSESLPLMYAIAYRHTNAPRDIPLKRLLREIEATLGSNRYPGKTAALEAAVAWVKALDRASVFEALNKLVARANAAGIDGDEFAERTAKAWSITK